MTSRLCPLRYAELFQVPGSATESARGPANITAATTASAAVEAMSVQASTDQVEGSPIAAESALEGHIEATQALHDRELSACTAESQTSTSQEEVADCIVVSQVVAGPMVAVQAEAVETSTAPKLRYSDPRAIYQRYVEARETWFNMQPRGSIKTNQQYRRAMHLPQRYNKAALAWCLDWKQMGKQCRMQTGSRDWTKEEMMAYLDWDKAEEDRVEAVVAAEMKNNPFSNRRGMNEIWEAAAADCAAQEALYSGN